MLDSIRYVDFRVFADATLELEPLTVLVGPNGAGKSTALDGIHFLLQGTKAARPEEPLSGYQRVFSGARDPSNYLRRPGPQSFKLSAASGSTQIDLTAAPSAATDPWVVEARSGGGAVVRFTDSKVYKKDWAVFSSRHDVATLRSVVRLRLSAEQLAAPHYSEADTPRVEYNGEGLASVLQFLQGTRDGRLERIESALRRVVPGAKRIRTLPARIRRTRTERLSLGDTTQFVDRTEDVTGTRFEVEIEPYGWIPAFALSEGTMLALGLLSVMYHQTPHLILLDDLDMALHPRAQQDLVNILRGLVEQGDLQIVCTTHSPFVVDSFKIEEVRVFGLGSDGYGRIKKLQDHPQWAKRSGFMKPGEFWSGVGEAWVGQ